MAWVGGVSGFGGGVAHDSTPHDSTQGWAEQRSTDQLPLSGTYELTVHFTGLG